MLWLARGRTPSRRSARRRRRRSGRRSCSTPAPCARRRVEHALTALAVDAAVVRAQVGRIEHPGALFLGVLERDPLVDVVGRCTWGSGRGSPPARTLLVVVRRCVATVAAPWGSRSGVAVIGDEWARAGLDPRRARRVLALVSVGFFITALDFTIVNVAFRPIEDDFGQRRRLPAAVDAVGLLDRLRRRPADGGPDGRRVRAQAGVPARQRRVHRASLLCGLAPTAGVLVGRACGAGARRRADRADRDRARAARVPGRAAHARVRHHHGDGEHRGRRRAGGGWRAHHPVRVASGCSSSTCRSGSSRSWSGRACCASRATRTPPAAPTCSAPRSRSRRSGCSCSRSSRGALGLDVRRRRVAVVAAAIALGRGVRRSRAGGLPTRCSTSRCSGCGTCRRERRQPALVDGLLRDVLHQRRVAAGGLGLRRQESGFMYLAGPISATAASLLLARRLRRFGAGEGRGRRHRCWSAVLNVGVHARCPTRRTGTSSCSCRSRWCSVLAIGSVIPVLSGAANGFLPPNRSRWGRRSTPPAGRSAPRSGSPIVSALQARSRRASPASITRTGTWRV